MKQHLITVAIVLVVLIAVAKVDFLHNLVYGSPAVVK
jgi:hypothetical protein